MSEPDFLVLGLTAAESAALEELFVYDLLISTRHCLYAGDPDLFASLLTDRARDSFDVWRADNKPAAEVD